MPTAPEQYSIHMTVSHETYEKLRRAQELIRHTNPKADPAAIFDRALTLLVAELEKTKFAATTRPHSTRETRRGSRHIPAGRGSLDIGDRAMRGVSADSD
jgi:hypothetical protein